LYHGHCVRTKRRGMNSFFDVCGGSSREHETSVPLENVTDNILELILQNRVEIDLENLPAGMMCPIRGVCPDRGWKNPRSVLKIKG
jgi:hypothetical protein